MVLRLEKTA